MRIAGALALPPLAADAQLVLVSSSSSGVQANGPCAELSFPSSDGRFVAFASQANNLVPTDLNGFRDVFVKDLQTGATTLVSVSSTGVQTNAQSGVTGISGDGRLVVFDSAATNLVAGVPGVRDVYVHDRQTVLTVRASSSSTGVAGNNHSELSSISDDGSCVAFTSAASNLVPGDTNGAVDVFVRDLLTGITTRVNVDSQGNQTSGANGIWPRLSQDGQFVVFGSLANNLVPGDTNTVNDIFVHDRASATTTRVSVGTGGSQSNFSSANAWISSDGRFVLFDSFANNLGTPDTNVDEDLYLHDRLTGITTLESVNTAGVQQNASFGLPPAFGDMSGDGRYIVWESSASNLTAGDANTTSDVFARDRQTSRTWRISVNSDGLDGMSSDASSAPTLSSNGLFVTFSSWWSLLPGTSSGSPQVYACATVTNSAFTSFCFGDSSGTACPCSVAALARGCPSSSSAAGSRFTAAGTPGASTSTDSLRLVATTVTGPILFLQAAAPIAASGVFGDGLTCLSGSTTRLGVVFPVNGMAELPNATSPTALHTAGGAANGDVRHYQGWYRDAAPTYCSSSLFNLTPGLTISWGP